MRSLIASVALSLLATATVVATSAHELIARVGIIETDGEVEFLRAPSATLLVRLDLEVETFEVGTYARYAQRHLGVQAPLVAKSTTKIINASIAMAPEQSYMADEAFTADLDSKLIESRVAELPINITSADTRQPADMASDAAEEVFWIRQLRSDILSGDLGDGFYGGGLEAALKRLDQQESQLVELFLGRTTISHESRVFAITLEPNTESYRVCRFSEANGIADLSDVSADLIMLSVSAIAGEKIETPAVKSEKGAKVLNYRVAAPSKCELLTQDRSLTSTIIPLFETGYDIKYVIPEKK
ncbi:MAG: DUF4831 family protein [Rikenellaceae bacterium]